MPGANLPELTREITSIPRDASEYPRRPMDGPADIRARIKESSLGSPDLKLQRRDFRRGGALVFKKANVSNASTYINRCCLQLHKLPVHQIFQTVY